MNYEINKNLSSIVSPEMSVSATPFLLNKAG
jgi:hypothetical protein